MTALLLILLLLTTLCYADHSVKLRWDTNSDEVTHYRACFANDSSMSHVRYCQAVLHNATTAYHHAQFPVPKRNGLYYRIKACNAYGCSDWSKLVTDSHKHMRIKR